MIDFRKLAGKRVALVLVDDGGYRFFPGVANLDEECEMFQIKPDDDTLIDGPDASYGIRYEGLKVVIDVRKETNCEYGVVVNLETMREDVKITK